MTTSLTDLLQQTRLTVVEVDVARRRLRVRGTLTPALTRRAASARSCWPTRVTAAWKR